MRASSRPVVRITGTVRAPGDKSCSHRAVMMAAVAAGESTVTGLLEGEDVLNTAKAVKALGAGVERTGQGAWTIEGVGAKLVAVRVLDGRTGNELGSRRM